MSLASRIERTAGLWQRWRSRQQPGPIGAYYRAGGQNLLHRDLPVSSESTVLDVGGFEGDWTAEMLARYGCKSVVYEPIPQFAAAIRQRFRANDRVVVHEAALGGSSGTIEMHVDGAGSTSQTSSDSARVKVRLLGVADVLGPFADTRVACMKVNIEGGEFEVFNHLLDQNLQGNIDCFLIQFHTMVPNADRLMETIRSRLAKTHACSFEYRFVWERWDRRP